MNEPRCDYHGVSCWRTKPYQCINRAGFEILWNGNGQWNLTRFCSMHADEILPQMERERGTSVITYRKMDWLIEEDKETARLMEKYKDDPGSGIKPRL